MQLAAMPGSRLNQTLKQTHNRHSQTLPVSKHFHSSDGLLCNEMLALLQFMCILRLLLAVPPWRLLYKCIVA